MYLQFFFIKIDRFLSNFADQELTDRANLSSSPQVRLIDNFTDRNSGDDINLSKSTPCQYDSSSSNCNVTRVGLSAQQGPSRQKDVLGDRPAHWGSGAKIKHLGNKSKNAMSHRNSSGGAITSQRASFPPRSSAVL